MCAMELTNNEMFLHLLGKVTFDVDTGCWFVMDDATWYIGRALYVIWFGSVDENYEPSPTCAPRYDNGLVYPCFSPVHVRGYLDSYESFVAGLKAKVV